jgi:hypothetical protein
MGRRLRHSRRDPERDRCERIGIGVNTAGRTSPVVIRREQGNLQFDRRIVAVLPVTIVGVSRKGFAGANVGETADLTLVLATLPPFFPERRNRW